MGWTTALTAVANTVLTAGQWNASVRDNLMETTPGKATARRKFFVTAGTNRIEERDIKDHIVDAIEERDFAVSGSAYVDLATHGPEVSLETGTAALVVIKCFNNSSTTANARMSYAVSGVTVVAAANNKAKECDGGAGSFSDQCSVTNLETALNEGINIFTAKYSMSAAGVGLFGRRRIIVLGL